MLQDIRKNMQGTGAKIIVAIIVVPFALFGIESLLGGGGVQYVAEVNGEGISAVELQQQINQQKRRLINVMGDNLAPDMLDDQTLAGPALEFMVRKALMIQAAQEYGLAIPDSRLGELIGDMDTFHTDGQFDPLRYRQLLSDQGYTPAGFQKALREDLLISQLRAGFASSEFATGLEVEQLGIIGDEQRDVRYMLLPLEAFRQEAAVSEEEILAWYEENQDRFVTEETVDLDYIELTPEDFIVPVEESRLREAFELDRDNFQVEQQRRVSHILFEPREDESDTALQERISSAQKRLESESFDSVAGELSDDIGSASFGGDLGFSAGDVFPAAMETAIAALPEGQVSEPLQTDAGWHLILVTEIRAGEALTFAEMRSELENRIQQEAARIELVKTVEKLRDLVFNAEDLAGPAAELQLEVERSAAVTRRESEGLFADARLNAAAFSNDVLNEAYNSEVIELTPGQFVVVRVNSHALPEARPLAEVRAEVEASLADEQGRAAIRVRAEQLLAQLAAGNTIEDLARENGYEWQVGLALRRDNRTLPASVLRRLFQLPAPMEDESTFEFVQSAGGDIELFELVRVSPGQLANISDAERRRLQRQLQEELGRRADSAFQQGLQENAEIIRNS